jgi:hypothetical protein
MKRVYFGGNIMRNGVIKMQYCQDVTIEGNHIVGDTTNVPLDLFREHTGIKIRGNYIENNATTNTDGVIRLQASAGASSNIAIQDNEIVQNAAGTACHGIYALDAKDMRITGNALTGKGVASSYGIHIRTTNDGANKSGFIVANNRFKNWATCITLSSANSATKLDAVVVSGNGAIDDQGSPTQTTFLFLDSGNNSDHFLNHRSLAIGVNALDANVSTPISNPAGVVAWVTGGVGGANGGNIYSVSGSPQSVITESPGAMALNRSGGASTTLYVKESGTNTNTGWVAK